MKIKENEANKFCFVLTMQPSGKVKVKRKWYKMVEVNGTYQHSRYEQIWLNSLHVMSNATWLITQIHMILIWIKKEMD